METEVDTEYKLHFQNLDQKREIRFLTKTVQELQAQLVISKVPNEDFFKLFFFTEK